MTKRSREDHQHQPLIHLHLYLPINFLQPIPNSLEREYNAVRNIPDIPPDGHPHQTAPVEENPDEVASTSPLDLLSPLPPPPPLPDPSPGPDEDDENILRSTAQPPPLSVSSRRKPNPRYAELFNLSDEQALSEDHELAYESIVKKINQMIEKGVWHPVHPNQSSSIGKIIPSKMFVKKKIDEQKRVKWKSRGATVFCFSF
jgi:hypothetical protein